MNRLSAILIIFSSLFGSFSFSAEAEKPILSVEIRIQGVPQEGKARIDGRYMVTPEKTILLPGIGVINIDGLASDVVAKKLREAFIKADIFTDPTFSVVFDTVGSIALVGFVRKPGIKPFKPGITIFQAITEAGGVNEFGSIRHVILMRGKTAQIYDLNKLENQQIELQVDDYIEVQEKRFL